MRYCVTSALSSLAILTLFWVQAAIAEETGVGYEYDDSDLTSFESRPDIKAPRFNVSIYNPDKLSPGLWFVAPYTKLSQQLQVKNYYHTCQTGPAIFDQDGELVWSGACLYRNQNAFDFRAWTADGVQYISSIQLHFTDSPNYPGQGIVLNNKFEAIWELDVPKEWPFLNMHELHFIENGQRVLYVSFRCIYIDLGLYGLEGNRSGWVTDLGFHEVDVATDEILFEWWSLDHIPLNASTAAGFSGLEGPWPKGWDWIHLNSVDKNSDGDYMISARYTNAIYKISGKDGSILWTLGGLHSDYALEDFSFSRQHDARFLSQKDDSEEVITFLDNGGDETFKTANHSSSLVVTLDKLSKVASVTKRWIRPGHQTSQLRGNFQLLPNGNAFTGWSDNCVISEHAWDGELLMEASFASTRLVTYRAYKFNFTGMPTEPPALKVMVYGPEPGNSVTVYYVSWNGATEVASWSFYRVLEGEEVLIGSKNRTGFETMFQSVGYEEAVFAEGLALDGSILGRSKILTPTVTADWGVWSSREGENVYTGTDDKAGNIPDREQDPDAVRDQTNEMNMADASIQLDLDGEFKTPLKDEL